MYGDSIRTEWQHKFEAKLAERQVTVDASADRLHGDFAMNVTRAPLIVSGMGPDIIDDNNRRTKNTIFLKVAGEDEFGGGFHDLRNYTDEEINKCRGYMKFVEEGWIKELSEDEYYAYRRQIEEHLHMMRTDPNYYWQVRDQEARSQNVFRNPASFERQIEPIAPYDLAKNREILNNEEDWRSANVSGRFETMSQFHRSL